MLFIRSLRGLCFINYVSLYILDSGGAARIEDCLFCPSGYFCDKKGLSEPSGSCSEGYYCPVGQNSSQPPDHKCRAGHYCEEVKTLLSLNRGEKILQKKIYLQLKVTNFTGQYQWQSMP